MAVHFPYNSHLIIIFSIILPSASVFSFPADVDTAEEVASFYV
jgi:hypothetical protein